MNPAAVLLDSHTHTPLCRHATGEPEEYARAARRRGLRGILVTCHNPIPDGYGDDARMYPEQSDEYLTLVARAQAALAGVAEVHLGMECEYYPGCEAWLEPQLATAPFEFILGSVHPTVHRYRQWFYTGDVLTFQRLYFQHLAAAAETGLYDALAHPDLVKNEAPEQWRLERIFDDVRRCLDRIAATGVALELNTSGLYKPLPEMNPGPAILHEMHARGIPVVLGSDAHCPQRVADRFEDALALLTEVGYTHVSMFQQRRRHEVPMAAARASLAAVCAGSTG
jgi:histidinol-phosphatase (PHP family)